MATARGFRVSNLDTTVVAQRPKLAPFVSQMVINLAKACQVPGGCVNVKATTTELLGFTGRGEGLLAHEGGLMAPGDSWCCSGVIVLGKAFC